MSTFAQVEISFSGPNVDPAALLDLKSTDKGILIPRLTTPARELISVPGRSLLVFDLNDSMFYFHDNGAWMALNELVRRAGSNEVQLKGNISIVGNMGTSGTMSTNNVSIAGYSNNALVPTGAIFMWSGSIASIPTGWALCDGTNGTPDLRERFIVGVGAADNTAVVGTTAYAPRDVSSNLVNTNFITLQANQTGLPAHNHPITDPGHSHTIASTRDFAVWINNEADAGSGSSGNEVSASVHPKELDFSTTGVTVRNVTARAATQSHENRPPYYALAFIIKLP